MINPNQVMMLGCWFMLTLLPGCSRDSHNPDVQFAKETFFSMVNGTAAEAAIDWENFRMADDDVGATYRTLNEEEKAEFRRTFLLVFPRARPT